MVSVIQDLRLGICATAGTAIFFYLLQADLWLRLQQTCVMCGSTTSGPLQVADSAYAWGRWTSESIWSTMASLLLFALDVVRNYELDRMLFGIAVA